MQQIQMVARHLVLLAVLGFALLSPGAAKAQLVLCSEASERIWVTYAYPVIRNSQLVTKGWHIIMPNRCETVLSGTLTKGTYYFYAVNDNWTTFWRPEGETGYGLCIENVGPFMFSHWACGGVSRQVYFYATCVYDGRHRVVFTGPSANAPASGGVAVNGERRWRRGQCQDENISRDVPRSG